MKQMHADKNEAVQTFLYPCLSALSVFIRE